MKISSIKRNNQNGFAAIVVTLIIMTILVLITIGFSQVVNREQQATIDRQLSSQAFYAAESGVNDAIAAIAASADPKSLETEDCDEFQATPELSSGAKLSSDDSVEYTCVLVDVTPDTIEKTSVETERPTVIIIDPVDESGNPLQLTALNLSWQSESLPDTISFPSSSSSDFPDTWGFAAPVLRLTATPLNQLNRSALIENTFTGFLRPSAGSGGPTNINVNVGLATQNNQGQIYNTTCTTTIDSNSPRYCNSRLDLSSIGLTTKYLLTLRAVYHNADIYIEGESATGDVVLFQDQQAVIDATGKAGDVLQRIQVRVPIEDQYERPGFGIETSRGGGICKQLNLAPGGVGNNTAAGDCIY